MYSLICMAPFIFSVYFFQAIKHFILAVYQIYFLWLSTRWRDRGQNTYKTLANDIQICKCAFIYHPPKITLISDIQFIHGMITMFKVIFNLTLLYQYMECFSSNPV